jgi:hypothetical protein
MYTKTVWCRLALFAALLAGPMATCRAETIALTGFTNFSTFSSYDSTNMTIGWRFTAKADISATQLGFWEEPGFPLLQSHQVGLWSSTGTLLGSTTVLPTSPLTASFRYEPIAPVLLTAGNTYALGASITSPFLDSYATFASSVTTAPEVSFLTDLRNNSAGGFSFPTIADGNIGRFGPNLQFISSVPEPSTLILAGGGVLGLLGYCLGRKRVCVARPIS